MLNWRQADVCEVSEDTPARWELRSIGDDVTVTGVGEEKEVALREIGAHVRVASQVPGSEVEVEEVSCPRIGRWKESKHAAKRQRLLPTWDLSPGSS